MTPSERYSENAATALYEAGEHAADLEISPTVRNDRAATYRDNALAWIELAKLELHREQTAIASLAD